MVDSNLISAFAAGMSLTGVLWHGADWLRGKKAVDAWFFWLNLIFCAVNVFCALT